MATSSTSRTTRTEATARSAALEAADAEGAAPRGLLAFFRFLHVSGRVPVDRLDAGVVPCLVSGEGHRELVAAGQAGQAAEVGQALALLLAHVVAVGQVRPGHRGEIGRAHV